MGDAELHPLLRQVGRRIAELRAERGYTQEQFAVVLRCSASYAQLLESGRQNLTLTSVSKIAALLGVAPADLLTAPRTLKVRPGRPRKQ